MPLEKNNRLKLGLWIVLPLLLFSFISNRIYYTPLPVETGDYELRTEGATQLKLQGKAAFNELEEIANNGKMLSVLKLNFKETGMSQGSPIQFLISVNTATDDIKEGKYLISRYISGFASEFNGVFGYANLGALGEQPYFSRTGHLLITQKQEELVEGLLEVTLEDVEGHKLKLEGSFSALRE